MYDAIIGLEMTNKESQSSHAMLR